ncbi:hypothetical protein IT400_03955 [Candidatus Nomurabacteria bacterium]|nr:hypothetical protein [Candidatus Nomurabacteria bacterium]
MPQKRTYILLFISIFTTLIAVGMFLFAYNVIKHKNQYASALAQTIEEKITNEDNVQEFRKVIQDTKQKNELLKSFIVNQQKIDEFVAYLEAQGDIAKVPVNIRNVEISITDPSMLIVTFDGISNFENVIRLIWVIENAPYKINVKNVTFNNIMENKWQINMSIEVISSQFK